MWLLLLLFFFFFQVIPRISVCSLLIFMVCEKKDCWGCRTVSSLWTPSYPFLHPEASGRGHSEGATDCCRLTDRRLTAGRCVDDVRERVLTWPGQPVTAVCTVLSVSVSVSGCSGPLSSAAGPASVLAYPSSTPKWGTEDAEMKSPHIRIQNYHSLALSLACFAYSQEFFFSFYSTFKKKKKKFLKYR